ncbi:MAG: DNA polymerase III subunit beta [Gammaproteobacteria bacterium]|nr:DNA polymerase III subunit beta [Gammaproteobacteria bacterium]MCY4211143.1 DNA polymerase III subunit beta [Gammaproteobacteria bacterium]MCY4338669.1 DNA polymerase III subunit beta [Gammaproteobacteria bacterium]
MSDLNGVVESRPALAILANVLINISPQEIRLTTTDMEVELSEAIPGEFGEVGEITVPARKILDICRALPEAAEIALTVEDERVNVASGRSRFSLLSLPAQEFPRVEPGQTDISFSLSQAVFKSLLERTAFAMARQDVRYYLNGVLLEAEAGRLRAVATDGHRLALCEVDIAFPTEEKKQLIMPRKGVMELLRLLHDSEDEVEIVMSGNHIRIVRGDLIFTSKLIDGKYPDYNRVIPALAQQPVLAQRETLKRSLGRASILSTDKYRGVKITLEADKLSANVHNPEQEQAEDEIDVEYSGEKLEVGFNVSYLLDAVSIIQTDKVKLSISSPKSGCLVLPEEGEECKYIVMPLML